MNDSEREHVEPTLNDEEADIEEDVLALRNRATGLVVDPSYANNTNDHGECHMKCAHDVLHELERGAGEFRTLGLTEGVCRAKRCTGDMSIIARLVLNQTKIELMMKITLLTTSHVSMLQAIVR